MPANPSIKLAYASRLGYGAALMMSVACVNVIFPGRGLANAPVNELAAPLPDEEVPAYEVSLAATPLPGAADLMLETAPPAGQSVNDPAVVSQLLESQSRAGQSVTVYPVVVDPALAAAMTNNELTNETGSFPLLLTQIEDNTTEDRPEFGAKGQTRWFLQAGAATEGDGESFGLLGGGASYFFAKGHSINLALNGLAFDLPDQDPVGVNLDLLVRSHWIRGENWSLYIDGGAGIIVTTSRVPNEGSSFNFTPQGGVGASINVNREKDQRLLLGLRYHHISNANTFESNPGLDTYMGYVGMTFPIN